VTAPYDRPRRRGQTAGDIAGVVRAVGAAHLSVDGDEEATRTRLATAREHARRIRWTGLVLLEGERDGEPAEVGVPIIGLDPRTPGARDVERALNRDHQAGGDGLDTNHRWVSLQAGYDPDDAVVYVELHYPTVTTHPIWLVLQGGLDRPFIERVGQHRMVAWTTTTAAQCLERDAWQRAPSTDVDDATIRGLLAVLDHRQRHTERERHVHVLRPRLRGAGRAGDRRSRRRR
jgi:hypothetical protein